MRIAIVGAGVSGLTAAHQLVPHHDVTVFEAGRRPGGHSHTVRVDADDGTWWVDTGFIVYNDRNYPRFEALLHELGVQTQASRMSFSVSDGAGFEYAGTPRGLFANPRHLVDPRFLRMIRDLLRFNREARALTAVNGDGPSLREFLADGGYSDLFVEGLIVPQAAAVWSADPAQMWSFPAGFLARFFENHGMLEFRDRPQWRTVTGGSRSYVEAIAAPLGERLRTSTPVERVERFETHVEVAPRGGEPECFDEVILACHSDQALAMLADPSDREGELLGAIPYQPNEAVLHTDTSLLPRRRAAWASWNYHLAEDRGNQTALTYWMNNLQGLHAREDYCVTLNRRAEIDPARIIATIPYAHPVYTHEGMAAQARHHEISGVNRTHYCGAYWGWGFHEDGVWSAERVTERIGQAVPA
jgi:uncharacterized protein